MRCRDFKKGRCDSGDQQWFYSPLTLIGRILLEAKEQSMEVSLQAQSKTDKCGITIWLEREETHKTTSKMAT